LLFMNDMHARPVRVGVLLTVVGFAGSNQADQGDYQNGMEKSHSDQVWRYLIVED